ncbi:uncharacterized protein [Melanerpes formicivorus]|uniref:uncharacterized protein isoform X2 n=1 Tax=Melanerpes formicivorus TaxID=211600 RepID=UPI00358E396D
MQRRNGERQQLGPGPSDPAASPCGTSRPQPRQTWSRLTVTTRASRRRLSCSCRAGRAKGAEQIPTGLPHSQPALTTLMKPSRESLPLLQSAGDELDRQLREDARLRLFFKDLSYSSFKDLADAYVHREMRASRPDADLQEVQFAFTVHLTAKVAGICNQAVNRIMGFGTRYLEDSFPPYSKILQRSRDQSRTDNFESPD